MKIGAQTCFGSIGRPQGQGDFHVGDYQELQGDAHHERQTGRLPVLQDAENLQRYSVRGWISNSD